MKEIQNKILDDFFLKNHKKHLHPFNYSLFQDICHRITVQSTYSRFFNDNPQGLDERNAGKPARSGETRQDMSREKRE